LLKEYVMNKFIQTLAVLLIFAMGMECLAQSQNHYKSFSVSTYAIRSRVIFKMANWYDQYAGRDNDNQIVPLLADRMFAGTESRLWVGQEQHLQPYLSYNIMHFMGNLKPGINKGGWVDKGILIP
jgi:hypothetical protein